MKHSKNLVNLRNSLREGHKLKPFDFIIGQTLETIKLPNDLAARVEGKSSLARFGLVVHMTAPTVHPGFDNHLTLEICNLGPVSVELAPGMKIAQLIIEQLSSPSKYIYQGSFNKK